MKNLLSSIALILAASPAFAWTDGSDNIQVYGAYYDTVRPNGKVPVPWAGTPNVVFLGDPTRIKADTGAIGLFNSGKTPVQILEVAVDILPYRGINPWAFQMPVSGTIPPGHVLILAGSAFPSYTFDTSETSPNCTQSGVVPVINITTPGGTRHYYDKTQSLNTGGIEGSTCKGNESEPWVRIFE